MRMRKVKGRDDSGERAAVKAERKSDAVPTDREESAPHSRVPESIPAPWLDRLLAAVLDLPLASGERAVVTAMVDAVSLILPDHAVGACVVPVSRGQFVVKRVPEGLDDSTSGVDPTRLFPGLAHEHVTALAGSTTGSTFHLGSNDDDLERRRSPAVHLVERAALALGRALESTRQLGILSGAGGVEIEERMVQADKLATFGQIAAGIVHELNNPLTSIVAYSDYLIRKAVSAGGLGEADDVERLRRISESATRMLGFARDLISYARPSSGARGPVVLHDVIDQAIAFYHDLRKRGVCAS